jgi:phage-related protein
MGLTIILKGKVFNIWAMTRENRCPVEEFIDELEIKDQRKVLSLLDRIANHGMLGNEEKFHKLKGKGVSLWELKSFQVRIFCFFDQQRLVILTHGFRKKGNETPREEIEKALRFQKEYFKDKENG